MTTHYVYRLYGSDDTLLYVGMTNDPDFRMRSHLYRPDFGRDIVRMDIVEYDTREEASAAEVLAISTELPMFNVHHNPNRPHEEPDPEGVVMTLDQVAAHFEIKSDSASRLLRRHKIPVKRGYLRSEIEELATRQGHRSDLERTEPVVRRYLEKES